MSDEPPSRILLLLRHGKAETTAATDFERNLVEKGEEQARLVGDYLVSQGISPSRVLVSAATRTKQTWQQLASCFKDAQFQVDELDELYLGGVSDTLAAIKAVPADQRVLLVVGHEPTMSQLAFRLADEESSDSAALAQVRIGVPTGSMSVLTASTDSWEEIDFQSLTLHTLVRS